MEPESLQHHGTATLPDCLLTSLLARIAEGTLELPLLPDVAAQLISMSPADDIAIRALANLVHRDQTIASHVLRVANSPIFRPRTPIVSLQQAVSRLGMTNLRDIVISVVMHSRVFAVAGYTEVVHTLWHHALATATYAKEIARLRRHNVEGAFLCGLLHDVGKAVLLLTLNDLQRELGHRAPLQAIVATLETYHTYVGQLLATAWSLPPEVSASITYHHDPLQAPTAPEVVMTTYLADRICYALDTPDADFEILRHDPVCVQLNLYPDDLTGLFAQHEALREFVEAIR